MPVDVSRVRALCFDVDGTLRDTDDQYVEQLAAWCQPLRFLFKQRDPCFFARRVIMAIESPATFLYTNADRLGFDTTFSRLLQRTHHIGRDVSIGRMIPVPFATEVIKALAPRFPLAIVSARHEEATRDFLTRFELLPYFKAIATAHTCRYTKPYPDPIFWVAQQLGVSPHECLMIGDTSVDIRAARAAGAQAIGVLCGFGREKDLLRAGADMVVPGTSDVRKLLDANVMPSSTF